VSAADLACWPVLSRYFMDMHKRNCQF